MDRKMTLAFKDFDNKYIEEKTVTLKFDEEKYQELREIASEIDDNIEEVMNIIVEYDLLERINDKDFKQLVLDAYYSEMFEN